jgi:hypothetical protein
MNKGLKTAAITISYYAAVPECFKQLHGKNVVYFHKCARNYISNAFMMRSFLASKHHIWGSETTFFDTKEGVMYRVGHFGCMTSIG